LSLVCRVVGHPKRRENLGKGKREQHRRHHEAEQEGPLEHHVLGDFEQVERASEDLFAKERDHARIGAGENPVERVGHQDAEEQDDNEKKGPQGSRGRPTKSS
jgi:hypothetical protein